MYSLRTLTQREDEKERQEREREERKLECGNEKDIGCGHMWMGEGKEEEES